MLADGATLTEDQTAVPLELDQIYSSMDRADGRPRPDRRQPQRRAVRPARDHRRRTSAARASSSTRRSRTSASSPRRSTTTRRSSSAPPRALEGFISTLADNDQTVRQFNQSLGRRLRPCSRGSASELKASLQQPRPWRWARSRRFVKENRDSLGRNIKGLNRVAKVLVKQRGALDEMLTDAPARAEQPLPDLQPAGRHARHPRQPRREHRPARERPRRVPVRPRQPGRHLRTGLRRDRERPALPGLAPRRGVRPGRYCRPSRDRYDPTLGGLVEVER